MKVVLSGFLLIFCSLTLLFAVFPTVPCQTVQMLDPSQIPKFTNQLSGPPPVFVATNTTDAEGNLVRQEYAVQVLQFNQQMLPTTKADGSPTGFSETTVWGYQGPAKDAVSGVDLGMVGGTPGCTFEAVQGVPVKVKWINDLVDASGSPLSYFVPVDPTIHWANPNGLPMGTTNMGNFVAALSPVPIVTHLHGGEVPPTSDGYPDSWYTADGKHGPAYTTEEETDANAAVYIYPNTQPPTTLWYHDHALGLTRLNVLSGLAGFYIIQNASDPVGQVLPSGAYDMPLLLQDRSFYQNGSLYYPTEGNYPTVHPVWQPTFLGNTIVVNGLAWPNMNVEQGVYRFRILDGSNSRFYQLQFSNGMSFTQVGSDGGYLKAPVQLTSKLIAPAERVDILVDFSNVPAGQKIVLQNTAELDSANAVSTGQIMQFTVVDKQGVAAMNLPQNLNPTLSGDYPNLSAPTKTRILTLTGLGGSNGDEQLLLDGQDWSSPISENPKLGSTEDWVLVNAMMAVHPIHLHLIQFQIVSRQNFDIATYLSDWTNLNGEPPFNHSTVNVETLTPYLIGEPRAPER